MGNLLTSLLNSANALDVMNRQFAVIQNNVANANTPGYVRQTQSVLAMPLETSQGLPGGVKAGPVLSARSEYAEQTVRRQNSLFGAADQRSASLTQIEPLFDLSGSGGLSSQLDKLFQSFSQLGVNPNDTNSRQSVIDQASNVAASFRQMASALSQAGSEAGTNIQSTLTGINHLTSEIASLNASRITDSQNATDSGMDAQMHSDLEELSQMADVTVLQDSNGAFNVYLGGQTPLVLGSHQFALSADISSSRTAVLDGQGKDVTSTVHSGQLGALIDQQQNTIPSYLADLNQLASTLATSVNGKLNAGLDSTGANPTVDLFAFDPTAAAATLDITGIQPSDIAAARAGAPGGNGNALDLASLGQAKLLGGSTLTQYYGSLATKVGQDVSSAADEKQTQQDLLNQARSMRTTASGVSLNDEAALLMQVQQQYQATGKLIGVLDNLTDTLMSIIK